MTRLAIVSPCYNEEAVLDSSVARLTQLLDTLVGLGDVSAESMIVFVNDSRTSFSVCPISLILYYCTQVTRQQYLSISPRLCPCGLKRVGY